MKRLKTIISILFFSFLSFSEVYLLTDEKKIEDINYKYMLNEKVDKSLIKGKMPYYKYHDADLIKTELIRIDGKLYIAAKYDVEAAYSFNNNLAIRSMHYDVYHPIFMEDDKFVIPRMEFYLKNLMIYNEEDEKRYFYHYEKIKDLDLDLFKKAENIENSFDLKMQEFDEAADIILNSDKENKNKVADEIYYAPYMEFDKDGYAYIAGTNKRLTANNVPLLMYRSDIDQTIVMIVDYDNGRFISTNANNVYFKKGKAKISDLYGNEEQELINIKTTEDKFGVKYNEVEKIAKFKYKDAELEYMEILAK